MVAFDTEVVDLTERLADPVEVLFGCQLGGGTDVNRALAYCQGLITRPADHGILRGITRSVLIEVIRAQGLTLEERPFTAQEAYGAREAFLTSASQIVMPVTRIDDRPIGNGAPGSVATALRAEFHRYAEAT